MFIGGAFALGLVGARFLKSSSPNAQNSGGMYESGGASGSFGSTAYVTGGATRAYAPATPARPTAPNIGEPERF